MASSQSPTLSTGPSGVPSPVAPLPTPGPGSNPASRPGSAAPTISAPSSRAASTSAAPPPPPPSQIVSDLVPVSGPGPGFATPSQHGTLPATTPAHVATSGPAPHQPPNSGPRHGGWGQHPPPPSSRTPGMMQHPHLPVPPQYPPQIPQNSQPHVRPAIMDPPGTQVMPQVMQNSGFASPTTDHARENPKFVDDVSRMTYAIQQSLPQAVRRVVRDHWEKAILGSDFHQAFILNASLHHATPSMTRLGIRDFGKKMVNDSKGELIQHFSTADFDQVTDTILDRASNAFLDRALAQRLKTIEAKPLINALARAERLGYEPGDIVEEDQGRGQEHVIPGPVPAGPVNDATAQAPGQLLQANPGFPYQCRVCFRTFQAQSSFFHHTKKQVCSRQPPTPDGFRFSCPHCGQGFTTKVGMQYHLGNKICGDFTSSSGQGVATPVRPPMTAPIAPPSGPMATPSVQRVVQPIRHSMPEQTNQPSPAPGSPYAHLTPQKLAEMNEALRSAEVTFTERVRQADEIADPDERRVRLEALRNSFSTKQSIIRKKFGVRLRERRSRVEIEEERLRMGLPRKSDQKAKTSATSSARQSPSTSTAGSTPVATGGAGFTPANAPRPGKRPREDETTGDTPNNKRIAVSEMEGGLNGTAASAATQDPTLPPSMPRAASHPVHLPLAGGSQGQPLTLSEGDRSGEMDSDDDDDDNDGDIPAKLPAAVRMSLTPAGRPKDQPPK